MILGNSCNNILTMEIANTFFNKNESNTGIIVWDKVTGVVIEIIGGMVWQETEFNNSDKDYII